MTPEERMRRFNDRSEWTARLAPRPHAFAAKRRMSPWMVSLATVAAIAVVVAVVFGVFGLSVQSLRRSPASPAVQSQTPTPTVSAGTEPTCENLISPATRAGFSSRNLVEVSGDFIPAEVAKTDGKGKVGYSTIAADGGRVCGRGSSASADPTVIYGFGYLSPIEGARVKPLLAAQGYTSEGDHEYVAPAGSGGGTFYFGQGFWAFALDADEPGLLEDVVRNGSAMHVQPPVTMTPTPIESPGSESTGAPSDAPTGKPATPAKPPYLTSEGLGDLRIGQKIPASSTMATYSYLSSCKADRWHPATKYGDGAFTVLTTDRSRTAPLAAIILRDDTIPTKSGIRVGDSLGTLLATYKKFDAKKESGGGTNYVIRGTAGEVVFEVFPDSEAGEYKANTVAAISLVPASVAAKNLGSVFHTDAVSPCAAA
jgi:hypothetical protein